MLDSPLLSISTLLWIVLGKNHGELLDSFPPLCLLVIFLGDSRSQSSGLFADRDPLGPLYQILIFPGRSCFPLHLHRRDRLPHHVFDLGGGTLHAPARREGPDETGNILVSDLLGLALVALGFVCLSLLFDEQAVVGIA